MAKKLIDDSKFNLNQRPEGPDITVNPVNKTHTLRTCPMCGSANTEIQCQLDPVMITAHAVTCCKCGYRGIIGGSKEKAIKNWNTYYPAASPWCKVCDIDLRDDLNLKDGSTIIFYTQFGHTFVKTLPLRVRDCIIATAKARSVIKFAIVNLGEESW